MAYNGVMNNIQAQCSASCAVRYTKWNVNLIINQDEKSHNKYAVIVLNRPITQKSEFIRNLWNNASVRVTVDGGTIRWETFINALTKDVQKMMKIPDLITGDFDSITKDKLEEYKQKGCKVIHTPDQNYTDFTKSLMELNIHCNKNDIQMDYVIVIGQCSGRLDQVLANIQTLFLARTKQLLHPDTKLFILSDDSVSWLLTPGDHEIIIPDDTLKHKRAWCSIVPIGETCEKVTSSGLKWNLDDQPLKFGDVVSTSNAFNGTDKVKIKCSHTILWSMRTPCLQGP